MQTKLIKFQPMGDHNGKLISLESNLNIPFDIRRVYYIYGNLPEVRRGFHAHHNLKQVIIAIAGSCTFTLDNGYAKENITLHSREEGLFIDGIIWREMSNFSNDCILMVLASELYDESDYIREYKSFLEKVRI